MKRHRGAKQFCQYGLSRIISLLSLAYLLFVGDGLSTQHHRITMADVSIPVWIVILTVRQPFAITLYSMFPTYLRLPLRTLVTLYKATAPVKLPTKQNLNISYINKHKVVFHCCLTKLLAQWGLRLPHILNNNHWYTMFGYSKGAQGLFV